MRLTALLAALAVSTGLHPVHAQNDAASDKRDWRVTVGGGVTSLGEDRDQPYGTVALRRNFDDFYVSLGGTIVGYSGRDPVAGDTIPATTRQLAMGAGYENDALAFDMHFLIGDRDFEQIDVRGPGGTPLTFDADGGNWSLGASLTYQFALSGRWYAAPFAAIYYDEIDTAQIFAAPDGRFIGRDIEEGGVTGSGGTTLQYALGQESQHSIGAYGAIVVTSNTASTTQIAGNNAATGAPRQLDGTADGDSWFEYGASTSFAPSDTVVLDLWISRTAGLGFGEATSVAASFSFDF